VTRQFKIVKCPYCHEFTYLPLDARRHKCPRCNEKVDLHTLDGEVASSAYEAQELVQAKQYTLYKIQPPIITVKPRNPATAVLRLLRQQHDRNHSWLSLHIVYDQCAKLGLSHGQVHQAITALTDEGFLEIKEGSIRAIPIS
jgi:ABC-type ATPase with predicted acetyltransferase domain